MLLHHPSSLSFLFVTLSLACGIAGDARIPDAGPASALCAATSARLYAFDPEEASASIGDVTGDGLDDVVTVIAQDDDAYRIEVGAPPVAEFVVADYLFSVGAGDLDGDGHNDLILGALWANQVQVFRGPVTDNPTPLLTINGPTDPGGLAPLMGSAVLVTDVNGDQVVDLVITAPAEGEEACAGTQPPRVYLGPFSTGAELGEGEVDLRLEGPKEFSCLGETATCTADGFELSAIPTTVCYALPLSGDASPGPCP